MKTELEYAKEWWSKILHSSKSEYFWNYFHNEGKNDCPDEYRELYDSELLEIFRKEVINTWYESINSFSLSIMVDKHLKGAEVIIAFSDIDDEMKWILYSKEVLEKQPEAEAKDTEEVKAEIELHSDSKNLLNTCFQELTIKMIKNQEKYGYSNEWLTQEWENECREKMISHIQKGDPRDIAIYAMFMMYRGWSTTPKSSESDSLAKLKEAKERLILAERIIDKSRSIFTENSESNNKWSKDYREFLNTHESFLESLKQI